MADKPNADERTASNSPLETEVPGEVDTGESENQESQPDTGVETEADGGAAQRRIQKLAREKKLLSQKIADAEKEKAYWRDVASRYAATDANFAQGKPQPTQQPPATPYPDDEVEKAVRTLKERGMVTKDELENILEARMLRVEWDRVHDRLEDKYNRRNANMPHYDRNEVEEYARSRGISDPEIAYRDLYFDEIMDMARKGQSPGKPSITTQKPSKPTTEAREPMTLESFRAKLRSPEGRAYYEKLAKNPEQLNELLNQLTGSEEG